MSQGCALLNLRSKGQRSRSWRMVIWKWFPDDNWLCNQPMIMKLHTLTHHESRMRPIDFGVKGQGHGAWLFENGFRTITDSVINLWSWNFIHLLTMSQGCALLILRSKGQRSRSWRMVIWKWFPDDNWLCNQPNDHETSYTYSPWICWGRWGTCIASAILSVCFYMLPLYVAPLVFIVRMTFSLHVLKKILV